MKIIKGTLVIMFSRIETKLNSMELTSENSMLKNLDKTLESPVLNPSQENISCHMSVSNPVTSHENNSTQHQGSESDPILPSPKCSNIDRRTILGKIIHNHNPSFSNDSSGDDLPLTNPYPAKGNLSLKRKSDSPTSSNTKKIMVSPLNTNLSKQYLCSICGRSFKSYQALGGHKVHHNKKVPAIDVDAMVKYAKHGTQRFMHECSFCNKAFSTGQALGGHRRHCREPVHGREAHRNGEIEEGSNQNRGLNFDLNELPEEMDDTIGHV